MIHDLLHRAKRRVVLHESMAQMALAASVAVGGLALLLLFGTTYLAWWSVAGIAFAALAFGVWRILRAVPGEYALAVQLDTNAGLHDTLSTAIHFTGNTGNQPFRSAQYAMAEGVAQGVDLEVALPFATPRSMYVMAGLALLATGLFIARYSMMKTLDLRAPLTQVLFEDQQNPALAKGAKKSDGKKTGRKMNGMESLLSKLGVNLNQDKATEKDALDQAIEEAMKAPAAAGEGAKGAQSKQGGAAKDGATAGQGEKGEKGDPLDGGKDEKADAGKDGDKGKEGGEDSKSGDQQAGKNGNSGDNASLLSKLKDAVSNMMSKAKDAKSDPKGGKEQGGDQQAKQEKAGGEKGKSGQGQQKGEQQANAQQADPNGDGQEGQQSQGKAGSKDSDQKASSQPGSGVGHQDGSKDMKAAEQLKAMGKLSEIIGKRSSTVSGETSVEVESGSQQLKTAYTNSKAGHAETDGDVNRDEVPAAMQQYVQQYFQQVRKPGTSGTKPAVAAKP